MEQDARQRLYNEIGQMRSNSANSTNMYMNSVEMAQASMAPNQVYQGGSFNRLLGSFSNGNNQQNIPSNMPSSLAFPPNSQRFMVPRMYDNEIPHSSNFMNGDNCVLPGLNSQHQHMCDRYRQINHHDHIALLNQLDSGFASSNQSHKSHQSHQSHPSHSAQQSLQQSQYCQLNTLRADHQRTSSAPPQSMISSMGSSLKGMIGERNIENIEDSPASFAKIQDQQLHKPQHTQNEASGFQALQGPAAAEEAAKKSSVHYFPCRAKGMDLDHNFEHFSPFLRIPLMAPSYIARILSVKVEGVNFATVQFAKLLQQGGIFGKGTSMLVTNKILEERERRLLLRKYQQRDKGLEQ